MVVLWSGVLVLGFTGLPGVAIFDHMSLFVAMPAGGELLLLRGQGTGLGSLRFLESSPFSVVAGHSTAFRGVDHAQLVIILSLKFNHVDVVVLFF